MALDYKAIAEWALTGSTGLSATCIAKTMMGLPTKRTDHPHDGGDFGRCERLLNAVPDFRARLPEMMDVSPYWAALVPEWSRIAAAPDQYRVIRDLLKTVEASDPASFRISENATVRFAK